MGGSCYDLRVMTAMEFLPMTTRNHNSLQWICNTPYPTPGLSTHIIYKLREREKSWITTLETGLLICERTREREREREREGLTRLTDPDPRLWPGDFSYFRPPFRASLVPIRSLRDEQCNHAILATGKQSESHRSKPWSSTELPARFAVISPVSGEAITWVLFLPLPSAISD